MHYWRDVTRPAATRAVRQAGLIPARAAPFRGVKSLFPHIDKPTPLQLFCEEVAFPDGPILFVIEDMAGAGNEKALARDGFARLAEAAKKREASEAAAARRAEAG
jgi:hypothetical protein